MLCRYIKEREEYKKTDSYKEFRRQQMEQKDPNNVPKKIKQILPNDNASVIGKICILSMFFVN